MRDPARSIHPVVWSLLIVPFGAVSGFTSVAIAFLATRRGLTVTDGATVIAVGMLPHAWKFFWGPVADTTLTRKRWYLLSGAFCCAGIVLMSAIPLGPSTLHLIEAVVFMTSLATTFLGMAVEGLMAHLTAPDQRGRVGGWFQAGNFAGGGLGGGAGLWMVSHLPSPWMSGFVLSLAFAGCAAALWWLPDVQAESRDVALPRAIRNVGRDLWGVLKSRQGILCAILCFLPIGTGAASGVLAQAEVAAHWHAGEYEVELVNGLLVGLISAWGCLIGGWLCSRYPSRRVYATSGGLMAAVAAGMAMAPSTPAVFIIGGLAYSMVAGLAFAAFTGFVLEVIGAGAAATKYNIFAALSNTPITYMGLVLAWSVSRRGADGMLLMEAAAELIGIIILGVAVVALGVGRTSRSAIPVPAVAIEPDTAVEP
jgi:MFS family permease